MAPRTYTQRRRAELASATRDRIVDAALEAYRDLGVRGATLKAIAGRADVSRGTILHHFGDAEGLLEEALERLLTMLELPDEQVLEGKVGLEARVRTYVAAVTGFFRRSASWWQVFQSAMERPAAKRAEAAYNAQLARFQAAALGPELARDPEMQAAMGALLHPGTMGSVLWVLESAGTPEEEVTRVLEDMVVGFLAVRLGPSLEPGRGG